MKLNLGSGERTDSDWIHVDRGFTDEVLASLATLLEHDLTEPLPFKDGEASIAVAHHVLDAFEESELHALCAEVYRVLEPGGVLRVSSPDYEQAVKALVRGDYDWFEALGVPVVWHIGDMFEWYLWWGEPPPHPHARATPLLSPEHLGYEFLEPAGFTWTRVAENETTMRSGTICELDSRADESWFVEATKARA